MTSLFTPISISLFLGVSDLQGVKISVNFPLTLLVAATTVLRMSSYQLCSIMIGVLHWICVPPVLYDSGLHLVSIALTVCIKPLTLTLTLVH